MISWQTGEFLIAGETPVLRADKLFDSRKLVSRNPGNHLDIPRISLFMRNNIARDEQKRLDIIGDKDKTVIVMQNYL